METLYDTVSKKLDTKRLIYSLSGIIFSVIIIYTAIMLESNLSSTIHMLVITTGVIVGVTFIIKLIFGSNHNVYEPTNCELKNYSFYFKGEETLNLISAIENGNISIMRDILGETNSVVKLDIIISTDNKFAACQIFKYVPYNYEPNSKIYKIDERRIAELHDSIKGMNNNKRR